jgi:hypothetical protein
MKSRLLNKIISYKLDETVNVRAKFRLSIDEFRRLFFKRNVVWGLQLRGVTNLSIISAKQYSPLFPI